MIIELTTKESQRRVLQAIADCERFIAKEEPRAADIRPASVQQHLDFCHKHMAKLQNALEVGFLEV